MDAKERAVKNAANGALGRLSHALRTAGALMPGEKALHIRHARVPILRVVLVTGLQVDVSMAAAPRDAARGRAKARLATHHSARQPQLRLLMLVAKTLLRDAELNTMRRTAVLS